MVILNAVKPMLFAAIAAAILMLDTQGDAQSLNQPLPSATQGETVALSMEQRHIVKEIIVKEMKVPAPPEQVGKVPVRVGEVVPHGMPLQPMPVEVAAKVPQLRTHAYLVKDEKVVIIDPKDNRVAALVE